MIINLNVISFRSTETIIFMPMENKSIFFLAVLTSSPAVEDMNENGKYVRLLILCILVTEEIDNSHRENESINVVNEGFLSATFIFIFRCSLCRQRIYASRRIGNLCVRWWQT